MKKYFNYILILSGVIAFFAGCVKDLTGTVYNGPLLVEIDATSLNSNSTGQTYPILTRIPAVGRPLTIACPDSTLRRYPQTIRVRVNLVGAQSSKDIPVTYEVFGSPITTIAFPATIAANAMLGCPTAQIPSAAAATLTVSDAVAGTHFTALSGTVVIPANSSFGFIDIQILNPGTTAGTAKFLGIRLKDNESIKVSVNYKQIGLVIDQR